MQSVKFQSIDEFLEYLPSEELEITLALRHIVLDVLPNCHEHLAYNVPFYKCKQNICFIWPASVLWGNRQTYAGVRFGLTKGYLLHNELGYFSLGQRKQVSYKDFLNIKDIDNELLRLYLYDALLVDG